MSTLRGYKLLARRIAAGAALLDKCYSRWWQTIDMGNTDLVLRQLESDLSGTLSRLFGLCYTAARLPLTRQYGLSWSAIPRTMPFARGQAAFRVLWWREVRKRLRRDGRDNKRESERKHVK